MGERREFACPGCGARAVVSGGPDSGIRSRTITVGCWTCGQLDDVVTAMDRGNGMEAEDDDHLPACRACGSDATGPWTEGDPCPRCRGAMARTAAAPVYWD